MKEDESGLLARSMRVLGRSLWTPETDEKRFLAGLPIVLFLIIPLWGRGLVPWMEPNPVLVIFALWWIAYTARFWKRLQHRGELKRVIVAPALFVALLLVTSLL